MPLLLGTDPNQVPTCGDLGTLAFQDAKSVNIQGGNINNLPVGGILNFTKEVNSGTSISAVAGKHYILTSASQVTVTLPASPIAGDSLMVTSTSNRVDNIIARNSKNINNLAENLTLDIMYCTVTLIYVDNTIQWRVI